MGRQEQMNPSSWISADSTGNDFLIPLLMIVAGAASLTFQAFIKSHLEKRNAQMQDQWLSLSQIAERFSGRKKVSLLLMAVGSLWMLQTFAESALAAR